MNEPEAPAAPATAQAAPAPAPEQAQAPAAAPEQAAPEPETPAEEPADQRTGQPTQFERLKEILLNPKEPSKLKVKPGANESDVDITYAGETFTIKKNIYEKVLKAKENSDERKQNIDPEDIIRREATAKAMEEAAQSAGQEPRKTGLFQGNAGDSSFTGDGQPSPPGMDSAGFAEHVRNLMDKEDAKKHADYDKLSPKGIDPANPFEEFGDVPNTSNETLQDFMESKAKENSEIGAGSGAGSPGGIPQQEATLGGFGGGSGGGNTTEITKEKTIQIEKEPLGFIKSFINALCGIFGFKPFEEKQKESVVLDKEINNTEKSSGLGQAISKGQDRSEEPNKDPKEAEAAAETENPNENPNKNPNTPEEETAKAEEEQEKAAADLNTDQTPKEAVQEINDKKAELAELLEQKQEETQISIGGADNVIKTPDVAQGNNLNTEEEVNKGGLDTDDDGVDPDQPTINEVYGHRSASDTPEEPKAVERTK
jgi:hypothetical protein